MIRWRASKLGDGSGERKGLVGLDLVNVRAGDGTSLSAKVSASFRGSGEGKELMGRSVIDGGFD